ncbi:MAG: 4-hydroxy-tetrahydrodipicolinate reductase [Pseudomonadota bacterium]
MRVLVFGASGRMGREIIRLLSENEQGCRLAIAVDRGESSAIGQDAAILVGCSALNVFVQADGDALRDLNPDSFDVAIDFTLPEVSVIHAEWCQRWKKPFILGTTGFLPEQEKIIHDTAKTIPILWAPNMSIGVNVCFALLRKAAEMLGPEYDIEIIEAHHRHKVDAPSGTALRMGEVVAKARNTTLKESAVYARQGRTGARDASTIGFSTIRGGDIVGDHTVLFAAEGERIEITHKASNRGNFARGAVRAAAWIANKPAGLYDMMDVISRNNDAV